MNANDVIEAYVTDVALQLPRKQRNDVAFELRALLTEELQNKAEAAGRAADAAMATELVNAFGRPAEVAARYRPTLIIIDPEDGYRFLRATVIGLLIIWGLGFVEALQRPVNSGRDLLQTLSQAYWGVLEVLIPSLWWPGVLVVGFGLAAWVRRRQPQTKTQAQEWKPRAGDRIQGGRAALVMGLVGILCGLFLLLEPRWILDFFWGGRAAPAAYEALTYTDTFRQRQAPWLLALILLDIPLYLTVLVKGRWSAGLRRIETGLSLVLCAVMVWTVLDGSVLLSSSGDQMFKLSLVLIVAFTLITMAVKLRRTVNPSPG